MPPAMITPARIPERMCIVCRQLRPRTELLRLVQPTGQTEIVPDPTGRTSGKGVYLCRSRDCLEKLQKGKRLRRLFAARISPETQAWMELELGAAGRSDALT